MLEALEVTEVSDQRFEVPGEGAHALERGVNDLPGDHVQGS